MCGLKYKYINTLILKNGDTKEYFKCANCPARIHYVKSSSKPELSGQLIATVAHTLPDERLRMYEWERHVGRLAKTTGKALEVIEEEGDDLESPISLLKHNIPERPEDESSVSATDAEDTTIDCGDVTVIALNDLTLDENQIQNLNWTSLVSPLAPHKRAHYMPTPMKKSASSGVMTSTASKSNSAPNFNPQSAPHGPPKKQVKFDAPDASFVSRYLRH